MSGTGSVAYDTQREPATYSIYRGHRSYECAVCGRKVPGSSTEPVYVLDDRRGGFEKRVEPACFERACEEEGILPTRFPRMDPAASRDSGRFEASIKAVPTHDRPGQLSAEQVAILRSAGRFPSDSTPDEVSFGLAVAHRLGLDVWLGQVRFLRFDPSDRIHPFVGIDGMRTIAQRSGQYDGREIDVETARDPDGNERPVRAICRVHRKDWSRPLVEEVRFDEAVRRRRDGQLTRSWKEMPITMLRKAAEARALRAAFPMRLAGVYSEEESPGEGNSGG
jgi:phage recombination protein Bet